MALNTHSAQFIRSNSSSLNVTGTMNISMSAAHSYTFWLKAPSNPSFNNNFYCLFHSISGHAEELFIYENNAGTLQPTYRRVNNVTGVNAQSTQDLSGAWHFIALTNDTSTMTLYIDGSSAATASSIADGNAGDPTLFNFGTNAVGGTQGLDGFMVALSSGEVTSLYSSPSNVTSSVPNLGAGYDFNSSLTTDVLGNFTLTNTGSVSQSTDVPFAGTAPSGGNFLMFM